MDSKTHFAISTALGAAIALGAGAALPDAVFLVGYAGLVGTAIDLDHFLIARLRTGDWSSFRFALSNPRAAILEQDRIFDVGAVGKLNRLLSHALVGGAVVALLAATDPFLALVSGVVVYAHVVSDLVHDVVETSEVSRV